MNVAVPARPLGGAIEPLINVNRVMSGLPVDGVAVDLQIPIANARERRQVHRERAQQAAPIINDMSDVLRSAMRRSPQNAINSLDQQLFNEAMSSIPGVVESKGVPNIGVSAIGSIGNNAMSVISNFGASVQAMTEGILRTGPRANRPSRNVSFADMDQIWIDGL